MKESKVVDLMAFYMGLLMVEQMVDWLEVIKKVAKLDKNMAARRAL